MKGEGSDDDIERRGGFLGGASLEEGGLGADEGGDAVFETGFRRQ